MKTYGDWFTGFGGMTLGAKAAGLDVVFGAEYDPKIAGVYRENLGDHVMVCDLLKTPVTAFPRVDVFHASPPCPNFSNAKANGEETENDIALSAKVAEYIAYHLPDVFTLENVYQYRNSKSWQVIAQALHTHGYLFNYWHVNMADYGVPQTRQRMIVIARRDGVMPQLPPATHTAEPQPSLFGTMPRWVSWYEAIEDLIPTLDNWDARESVLKKMPVDLFADMALVNSKDATLDGNIFVDSERPAFTITASHTAAKMTVYKDGRYQKTSPRIGATLQTFPATYRLSDSTSNEYLYRGIGNAVPPLFAEKLYRHLVPSVKVGRVKGFCD